MTNRSQPLQTRSLFRFSLITLRAAMMIAGIAVLSGCANSVRDHIRARDFRSVRAAREGQATASPMPNVPDMPGWTSDFETATAFALENGRRTVVFVQQGGAAENERAKAALLTSSVADAIGDDMRVTFDAAAPPQTAAQLGLAAAAPALVVLDSTGAVVQRGPAPTSSRAASQMVRR